MDLKPGYAKYKIGISVELKNHEKPVCVAEFLAMVYEQKLYLFISIKYCLQYLINL